MVEGARLESVFRGNSNVGSNPTFSASSAPFIQTFARRRNDRSSMVAGIKADIELSGKLAARFDTLFPAHLQIDGQ